MSNKIFNIDFNLGNVLDGDGGILMTTPTISYQAAPNWELHFVENVESAGSLVPIDVSQAVSWNAAVDVDFTDETQPMIRTLPSAIITSGAASGIIVVPLDANTETFYQKINGRNTIPAYFEIRGRDSNDRVIYDYRFRINALGAIDPQGGEPLPVVSGGVTMADVYALLRSDVDYEFSDDGTTWHTPQRSTDTYYRTRYPEGEWGEAIEMIKGADGTDGEDGTDGTNGVGFKVVGEYNAGTTYHPYTTSGYYEVVTHNGSSYAYINATASSGHEPSGTDSYWELIAAKGDTGSVENITVSDITDFDSTMSGILSGYALKGESYTIAQSNTLLAAKANASDVYTTEEADNKFVDIDELSEATGNLVTVSQWTNQNATFQGEIDYLSGVISGGGGGDLSNYTPLSTTQSISAYLQNEIDNIPTPASLDDYTPLSTFNTTTGALRNDVNAVSGGLNTTNGTVGTLTTNLSTVSGNLNTVSGNLNTLRTEFNVVSGVVADISGGVATDALSGVALNGEAQPIASNVAYVQALAMTMTTMPNANDTLQKFMLYLGDTEIPSGYTKMHLYERKADSSAVPPSMHDIYLTIGSPYNVSSVKLSTNGSNYWCTGSDYQGFISISIGGGSWCEEQAWIIEVQGQTKIVSDNGSAVGGLPWEATGWHIDSSSTDPGVYMTHSAPVGPTTYHWEDIGHFVPENE